MKNQKSLQLKNKNFPYLASAILISCMILPFASAYALGLPMSNLYDVFVEYTFGSFWLAVMGISAAMFLIMLIGGISIWTNLTYIGLYLVAMSIGYGVAIVTIPLWVGLMYWSASQIIKYWSSSS